MKSFPIPQINQHTYVNWNMICACTHTHIYYICVSLAIIIKEDDAINL